MNGLNTISGIGGATRLFAIVGDPISQARTPGLINPLIRAAGRDAVMVPFHVPQARFSDVMPALMTIANLDGLVLTYPFKARALDLIARASDRVGIVGGVNAMRREADGTWYGDIFDGVGLLSAVRERRDVAGASVLLIGAGGAGRAIAVEFARCGAAGITIHDIDRSRAECIAERIGAAFPRCAVRFGGAGAKGHDIVVNATPVGMKRDDGLPAQVGQLHASQLIIDIVPTETPTGLIRLAAEAGAQTVIGKAMTQGQSRAILGFFGLLASTGMPGDAKR